MRCSKATLYTVNQSRAYGWTFYPQRIWLKFFKEKKKNPKHPASPESRSVLGICPSFQSNKNFNRSNAQFQTPLGMRSFIKRSTWKLFNPRLRYLHPRSAHPVGSCHINLGPAPGQSACTLTGVTSPEAQLIFTSGNID